MSHVPGAQRHGDDGAAPPVSGEDDISSPDEADHGRSGSRRPQSKHWYRLALLLTVSLVLFVIGALPFAVNSMIRTLFGPTEGVIYDVQSGRRMSRVEISGTETDRTYINIALDSISEAATSISMTVSGHRVCSGTCPALDLLLLSLDDTDGYRGMAPSAELQIDEAIDVFTEPVELPVVGNPSLYPFDSYTIKLAVAGYVVNADGTQTALTAEHFADNMVVSVQDQVPKFVMEAPAVVALPEVEDADDLLAPVAGQVLQFNRPVFLQVLSVVLVLLIAISGALALLTRSIDDLLLGVGGLILGVWGIRSVMVPQPLPTLSVVDLSLSWVILCLLVGLAVRSAVHFHQRSELSLPWRSRRR